MFQKLGTNIVYPVVSLAPLGWMPKEEAPPPVNDRPREAIEGKSQDDKKEDVTEERKQLIELLMETTHIEDLDFIKTLGDDLLQQALTRAQELLTLLSEAPHIGLVPLSVDIQLYLSPKSLFGSKNKTEEEETEEEEPQKEISETSSNSDEDEEDEEEDAAAVEVEEDLTSVPIDRYVWMYQTGSHWTRYSRDLCEKLENARRNGVKEVDIKLNNESMTVRFTKGEKGHVHDVGDQMASGNSGEKDRVRRRILSQSKTKVIGNVFRCNIKRITTCPRQ